MQLPTARVALAALVAVLLAGSLGWPGAAGADDYKFLGKLGGNKYDAKSTANPYGPHGSPYSPNSINNPYGRYGSPYSPQGVRNPYTTGGPKIVAPDGKFLGRLNSNPYDPSSVANPYGRYGSPYSPNSINNPYGRYGSKYSPTSPNNPYATNPPVLLGK
jgi:phospholipase/lecithinase/hemolysin